jgi:hypothetical protein
VEFCELSEVFMPLASESGLGHIDAGRVDSSAELLDAVALAGAAAVDARLSTSSSESEDDWWCASSSSSGGYKSLDDDLLSAGLPPCASRVEHVDLRNDGSVER